MGKEQRKTKISKNNDNNNKARAKINKIKNR